MPDAVLSPDLPLGPFEDTPVGVWSAKGKTAKLHTSPDCSYVRSSSVARSTVLLNAVAIARMCSECALPGWWCRPGTGLGIFMDDMRILVRDLDSCAGPDEDSILPPDIDSARALLLAGPPAEVEDLDDDGSAMEAFDAAQEAFDQARQIRVRVYEEWRYSAQSLKRAGDVLARYHWLHTWAAPRIVAKERYLAQVQEQAAALADRRSLCAAARVARAAMPDLPADDASFAVLGDVGQVEGGLRKLWQEWQQSTARSWDPADAGGYLARAPLTPVRSRRQAVQRAERRAQELLRTWCSEALAQAWEPSEQDALVDLAVVLPEPVTMPGYQQTGFLGELDQWQQAAVVTWGVAFDWARMTARLRVPQEAAEYLRTEPYPLRLAAEAPDQQPVPADQGVEPGVFDDTPVAERRLLAAAHLAALRAADRQPDQLYVVFSLDAGVETLTLSALQRRCADNWQGAVLAGASDLPTSLIDPWAADLERHEAAPRETWSEDPFAEGFGAEFAMPHGVQLALRAHFGPMRSERVLRALALARGVRDLRTIGERRYDHEEPAVPRQTWRGLLATQRLDLAPFEPVTADEWRSGSGLPLGLLAEVQVYSLNADPRYEGKGHAPDCQHADRYREGLTDDYDLLSVADLLDRNPHQWCSKCSGYAVRRFDATQLDYYRRAHQLYCLRKRLQGNSAAATERDQDVLHLQAIQAWVRDCGDVWPAHVRRHWRQVLEAVPQAVHQVSRQGSGGREA